MSCICLTSPMDIIPSLFWEKLSQSSLPVCQIYLCLFLPLILLQITISMDNHSTRSISQHWSISLPLTSLMNMVRCHLYKIMSFVNDADLIVGALNFMGIYVSHPLEDPLPLILPTIKDDTPAYVKVSKGMLSFWWLNTWFWYVKSSLGPSSWQAGPVLTHKQILDEKYWYFAKNFVEQKYFEVERQN